MSGPFKFPSQKLSRLPTGYCDMGGPVDDDGVFQVDIKTLDRDLQDLDKKRLQLTIDPGMVTLQRQDQKQRGIPMEFYDRGRKRMLLTRPIAKLAIKRRDGGIWWETVEPGIVAEPEGFEDFVKVLGAIVNQKISGNKFVHINYPSVEAPQVVQSA